MRLMLFILTVLGVSAAQTPVPLPQVWQMQESGTTAGLRGIDSVDGTVAWASGTGGTVLKTVDGGAHWTQCAVPDGDKDGATLDFRGVQAFNANSAIIMSSGKGKLSRLYKTTNGCKSWKLIFSNPDKDGFWDSISFQLRHEEPDGLKVPEWMDGWLLGDPVGGRFSLFRTLNSGKDWHRQKNAGLRADPSKQGAFAASNSSLLVGLGAPEFGSGGSGGAQLFSISKTAICLDDCSDADMNLDGKADKWEVQSILVGHSTESSGIFSIAGRSQPLPPYANDHVLVAVGGDYTNPNDTSNTAAIKLANDQPWTPSATPPHGYRSTVQWSESLRLWITAGTNGSDISRDDGKTWQPLDDGNWNALSLPYIVGPKGRIARLNAAAIPKP
ncbi:MAG: hypothetical protein ABSE46_21190 [Terracidiphilus sp.]|jgi:photosystem II stability/assembly factor-like uncharacterized protein